jgi:hypothetical protein
VWTRSKGERTTNPSIQLSVITERLATNRSSVFLRGVTLTFPVRFCGERRRNSISSNCSCQQFQYRVASDYSFRGSWCGRRLLAARRSGTMAVVGRRDDSPAPGSPIPILRFLRSGALYCPVDGSCCWCM